MAQYNAFVVVLLLATMIDAEPNVRLCERGVQYGVRPASRRDRISNENNGKVLLAKTGSSRTRDD